MEIELYATEDGKEPFTEWLRGLKDIKTRTKIRSCLDRITLGNLGDHKTIGDGVSELRVDFGPGYRIYFGRMADKIVVLLLGGDKSSQARDIDKAKQYWHDYLNYYEKKKIQKIPGRTH